jgi:hypothetical protein
MKAEILKSKGITHKTKHHDYDYLYKSILEAMEEYHQHKLKEQSEWVSVILNNRTMEAEDKAEKLVHEINEELSKHIFNGSFDIAVTLAIKTVDEIIKSSTLLGIICYWQEVKQEIENYGSER